MTSERFHKAARDGVLDILKEATKKDCNARDDGGMTPTLWAAFEGHIDALRLLVARGGDPDKTDYFGNTALHLASARGHEYCVRFLVKFGCNIWSLDIDRHSARDLAAINGREMTLQFLDFVQADQELNNRKKSRILREKAEKDAEKRLKEYIKKQKMAEIRAEKEQKKLSKDRTKLDLTTVNEVGSLPQKPSILTFKGRVKPSPTFSDIVGTTAKKHGSAVCRKALAKKAVDDFKVEMNGKKSIRSLTGLRRDSEVIYVGTYETQAQQIGRRGRISDVWGTLSKAQSTPDLLGDRIYDDDDEQNDNREDVNDIRDATFLQEPASIFNRPGFGSVAFRRAITTTFDNIPVSQMDAHEQNGNSCVNGSVNGSVNGHRTSSNGHNEEISIGSAGSLARRQSLWDDDLLSETRIKMITEEETDEEWTPLQRFLVANNLSSIHPVLESEQIDLEALMLLTESDLAALKLPLGPKRKLMNAIANRKRALDAPENVIKDSKL
ncbi:SAM_USH1G_HARP domain-containing protein Sans isoform X2 [Megachile rotundata]|uniref:SAM_USH1G_HARP domain-containing protein Sans isoform X2 n=1 Tax=Megachile rotundata TaxID=143995 RepID=UPI000614C03A|nr:PREDICTED: Usher syndrome type-1G protein homolog isoform X2 [Megachile rotundata]